MAKRRIIFVSFVYFSITFFTVRAPTQAAEISQFDKKIAENLNMRWRSMVYKMTLYNQAPTSNKQSRPKAESLSLSFEIEVPDSELIMSTCPNAVVEQITDGRGSNIESGFLSSRSNFMYVHLPRFNGGFMPVERTGKPERKTLRAEFDAGLLERIDGEIGLKGHFFALTAESLEYVELPFRPNGNWVSITPDVEIRVLQARNEASMYHFEIEQRPAKVPHLADVRIGDYLPNRLVADRQFITQISSAGSGGGLSSGRIGGKGSGTGRAEKICFVIAVNPSHQTIPFKLEEIPLSSLNEPAPSRASSSNRTGFTPFKRRPGQVQPQFDKKVADCFKVNWTWITYRKTLNNPEVTAKRTDQKLSEKLFLCCDAEILDPKLVVGTCDIPIIEHITDGKGRAAGISMSEYRANRMSYRTPRYQMKYSPPSMLIRLEGKVRTALGLPLLARHRRPKRSLELTPVRLNIDLDPGLLRQDSGEIGSIKGYFHALSAESLKHVKVPVKSGDKWLRLTGDVEMQVSRVWRTGSTTRFEIKQRGQKERHASGLCAGDRLPSEIIVDRQFIKADTRRNSLTRMGGQRILRNIGGSASIGGRQVKEIDYLIAVGPIHYKIPFVLEHIPLPGL